MPQLIGKVCLVTGASRGIGKGIALQLAQSGATVYITGRTLKKTSGLQGSLEETAIEISKRGGGKCIPIQCDHSKDEDIQRLFEQIKSEQNGRLDILVNNAYSAVSAIMKYTKVPYWEQPVSMWDEVNNVGLRNHYACAVHAARLMVPRREGLIVNISSPGGLRYLFNVAYGIGKEACDRMAADCGHELRRHNVTFVSLWPGAVMTEAVEEMLKVQPNNPGSKNFFHSPESVEFAGKAIVYLAADPANIKKTGRTLLTADLADEYGFTEIDGSIPPSFRSFSYILKQSYPSLASFFPRWIKLPRWVLAMYGSKL